jgi:MraZ protein
MILTGSFERNLDDKLRVPIPKELREALDLKADSPLYIAPGTDGSLLIYREKEFEAIGQRLSAASPTQKEVRAFSRLFYAQARRATIDSQGRIRIAPELSQAAGLTKDVMLLGVQDHIELWDLQRWKEYLAGHAPQYDAIAEAAFEMPK